MNECGRCGVQSRDLRDSLVDRVKEAREDGRPFVPPSYAVELRCRDRQACKARATRQEPS